MSTILKVDDLVKNFGGLAAVSNVSMVLNDDELVALIGPQWCGENHCVQPADRRDRAKFRRHHV